MLLFNGSLHNVDQDENSFLATVYDHVLQESQDNDLDVNQVDLSKTEVPFFDPYDQTAPEHVEHLIQQFSTEELQIWIAPLYHGSIPGVMKNALDWLQLTSKNESPYLTDKKIGLICISDGTFGIQGINAMTAIAHTLRAWVLPYSIPINKLEAQVRNPDHLASYYRSKIKLMVQLLKEESLKNSQSV
ncbi:NADPH-dependent FMN reductase [Gracilimonas mengyeensis]|uniref:Arsenical resistance protein ArsH n=1 Tax=Gracilimonas mengyeensis TaxID=1302730 RepID=A0A521B2A0_9BACT|nr:NAD(P)H-dependent oxidoreductase [Gracilimonas mengyeensis]SMO40900.1 arsenical resistance protein ArsH [Gracilimonas mengyeensis]